MPRDAYLLHREAIAALTDANFYPIEWIDKQVWSGAIRLLFNDTALGGYELKTYPGGAREIHVMFAVGAMAGIIDLADALIAEGRLLGCHFATVSSRKGWGKVLQSRGFAPHQYSVMKDLRDGD